MKKIKWKKQIKTIMKTIKIKIKNTKNREIKDYIFNNRMVKADIFWVKEKNKVY